jgi:transcriptional regulator with XRE-family HTH domain
VNRVDSSNALGEYLRARREQVRPEDAGIVPGGLRRVPGLRREEVAILAGISADYYLRLEQGRDRNPSAQVLDALARVLRLDTAAAEHLAMLGGHLPRRDGHHEVPDSVVELLDTWTAHPAYVQNKFTDILAVNELCTALSPNYRVGVNMMRAVFLDPAEHALRRDWLDLTEEAVAVLRANVGPDLSDPRLVELVTELSSASDRFRELWASHDVRPRRSRLTHLTHPLVGDLDLRSNKLRVGEADDLMLVVYHAEPGTRNVELLAELRRAALESQVSG